MIQVFCKKLTIESYNDCLKCILILIFLFGVFSCKSRKNSSSSKNHPLNNKPKTNLTEEELLLKLKSNSCNYKFISISGKLNVKSENESGGYQFKLNMAKDSLIWASVSLIGIEGIRLLIDRDSIRLIDRTNERFFAAELQYIEPIVGFKPTISMVQRLLLGELPDIDKCEISSLKPSPALKLQSTPNLLVEFIIDPTIFRIKSVKAFNNNVNQSHKNEFLYNSYKKINDRLVPEKLVLNGEHFKKGRYKVAIENKEIIVNAPETSFKFKIPSSYERM